MNLNLLKHLKSTRLNFPFVEKRERGGERDKKGRERGEEGARCYNGVEKAKIKDLRRQERGEGDR